LIDQAGAADRLPAFDIARNCTEKVAGGLTSIAICSKSETDAKTSWPNAGLSLAHQLRKPALARAPPEVEQSYVELLTCLGMSSGANFSPNQQ
jgi:hypothetical protein